MTVLYIYRNPAMGFSIGKVFNPIEKEMRNYADVDGVYMPAANYKPWGLWQNIRAARKAIKNKHYDVVHITGADHYLVPFLRGQNIVLTVHDLGFYTCQNKKSIKALWKYIAFILPLRFANKVTFISKKSEEEAIKIVHFASGQTQVVYNPVGPEFHFVPKAFNADKPVILHIGTKVNKNIDRTIEALSGIPCHLRIVGKINERQKTLLMKNHVEYSQVQDLTDEQIRQEYENCDIVNFPSLYEGFGMPILEGQMTGRPVLTSNLSPMREIAGGACALVDPTDINSIRRGYEELLNNHQKYIEMGLENVKHYALDKITKQYYNIYTALCKTEQTE